MREYYEQRATAGLIISEGIWVSEEGQGWLGAPGIYNHEQGGGWKTIDPMQTAPCKDGTK